MSERRPSRACARGGAWFGRIVELRPIVFIRRARGPGVTAGPRNARYAPGMRPSLETARLLCVGWHGVEPSPELRSLLRAGVGMVILFARNAARPEVVRSTIDTIRSEGRADLILCVDQEGGETVRLTDGFTTPPPMRAIGALAHEASITGAAETGGVLGRELRAVGIDLDFAPVVDVDTNPANPVIGDRSFSRDPVRVAECAQAFIRAMQSERVAACAKHFPGHGDTDLDSHHALPRLAHDIPRLAETELPPFRAAIDARVASIMIGHLVVEAIDPHRPASLSPKVIGGLLRDELAYDGVVLTDDLEMDAIAARGPVSEAAVEAVVAGNDTVLCCHEFERQRACVEALDAAARDGRITPIRLEAAHARLDRLGMLTRDA